MGEVALAAEAIQYLPTVVTGVEKLWSWIEGVREANSQTAEWTTEIEAAFQKALLARVSAPEQQPDRPPGNPT
jgi:hypothetical protein